MNKYTFEFANVIEAENDEEAMNIFEETLSEQISNGSPQESIVDWFTIKKLHS